MYNTVLLWFLPLMDEPRDLQRWESSISQGCWRRIAEPLQRVLPENKPREKQMSEDTHLRRVMGTNGWAIMWERNRTENIKGARREIKAFPG